MELKGPDFSKNNLSEYTQKNIESYKYRLSLALSRNGISANMFADPNNTDMRNYIINYVNDVMITNKTKDDIAGISYRMVHTTLKGSTADGIDTSRTYPAINKYQGHLLIETLYFALEDKRVKICSVPFVESPLIIN